MDLIRSKRALIIAGGLIFGIIAVYMVAWGNPANMGICVACFLRDVSGGLGLHRAGVVQYLRPEIMGLVIGAMASALLFREFRSRGGSAPLVRFFLGAFLMIGALVFLGCPVRALLRLAGGDLNALTGLAGLLVGVVIGIYLLRRGFNLGRATQSSAVAGWILPVAMVGLLVLVIVAPAFIFFSESGPGSLAVSIPVALVVGLAFGIVAQRTRMCFVGGWRDIIMVRDTYLLGGIIAFLIGAFIAAAALGYINFGFADQPVAHSNHLWNFMGLLLVGITATLLGGCPLRQLVLTGEGDTDAGVTVLGILAGAAFAHNFGTASSPAGTGVWGPAAVGIGIVFCLAVGLLMRDKAKVKAKATRKVETANGVSQRQSPSL